MILRTLKNKQRTQIKYIKTLLKTNKSTPFYRALTSCTLNCLNKESHHAISSIGIKNGVKTFSTKSYLSKSSETPFNKLTPEQQELLIEERAVDLVDVCIVGGGPAGLATAIKLKQLDAETQKLRVVVLEKASDFGGHSVSGVILEPKALKELFPEEANNNATGIPLPEHLVTKVQHEQLRYLLDSFGASIPVPEPPQMVNKGKNFIASLSQVTKYLSEKAEELGVETYPGISVSELIYDKSGEKVIGVATRDMGIGKNGEPKDSFERGMEFHARQVVLAEGCHGSLTKQAIKKFDLRSKCDQQSYGLGVKEVWEVSPEKFKKGFIAHTMGYPLTNDVYGGGFMYHFGENLVAVGLVVGLDYKNPYVSPYKEFQKMKQHSYYKSVLEGGKCIAYGARALNEGGFQAVPKLYFPGGLLVGASAGFMNVPKIKGTHTAIKSGMLAAEEIYKVISKLPQLKTEDEEVEEEVDNSAASEEVIYSLDNEPTITLTSYESAFKNSWIYKELYEVRNIRPSFNTGIGCYLGMCYSGLDALILKGRTPWTFHFHKGGDGKITKLAKEYSPINYPKPDGKISFDIATSVSRTGTYHAEDERCHLRVPDQDLQKHAEISYPKYKGIEQKFCPAGVYEYVEDPESPIGVKFQINSQNCIHCKTCDIKVPTQDINWEVPEGGDGPKYTIT
ncbi:probable Probable electron transfer flavoprotein-ubiquinone oxidoreductase, mitochondrial [Saccharomycodes ludwigii]|uniref:Electron transfer flavoprotein-ubiquinone oxidoreductase n=1 Tax=Saccharomycodes ludwigii TaxID=36035 RepID=A0A376B976_9ASCO|nr:probable Probable electron transfer flavoprotein-ubiquinone oxidoreductase, mitochondrial [Saccharomycodes ludwigii]